MIGYPKFLILILTIIATVLIVIKFVFLSKKEIINVHETNVRAVGLSVFLILLVLLSSYYAVLYWVKFSELKYVKLAISALLVYPFFQMVYSYLAIGRYFKKNYRISGETTVDEKIRAAVRRLSEKLGLKATPEIFVSGLKGISPFVFGFLRKSYLVLPLNFDETLDVISDCTQTKTVFMEFILLHELSHAKSLDHVIVGWIMCMLKSFKYWVAALVLMLVACIALGAGKQMILTYSFFVYWAFFILVLGHFLFMSLLRKRELLADSMSIVTIQSKSKEEEKSYEVAEKLLVGAEVLYKTGIIGAAGFGSSVKGLISRMERSRYQLSRRVGRAFVGILSLHPSIKERIEHLKRKKYIPDYQKSGDIGGACWNGASVAVASVLIFMVGIGTSVFVMSLMAFWLTIFHSLQMVSQLRSSIYYFSFSDLPLILKRLSKDYLFSFLSCFILLFVLFVPGYLIANPPPIGMLLAYSLLVHFCSFILAAALGGLVQFSYYLGYLFRRETIYEMRYIPTLFIGQIALAVIATTFLEIKPIALLIAIVPGCGCAVAAIGLAFGIEGTGVDCWRCFKTMKFVFCLEGIRYRRYDALALSFYIFVVLTGPVILFGMLLDRTFVGLNIVDYRGVGLLLIASSVVAVLLVDVIGLKWKYVRLQSLLVFRSVRWMSEIAKGMGIILKDAEKLKVFLDKSLYSRAEESMKEFGMVTLEYYYYAVLGYVNLGYEVPDKENFVRAVRACEDESGGFSLWKGSAPRLGMTFYAVSILNALGVLDRIDLSKHVKWIKGCETSEGLFEDPNSNRGQLQDTFYALQCLSIVNDVDGLRTDKISALVLSILTNNKTRLEEFYLCSGIIKVLDLTVPERFSLALLDEVERLVYSLRIDIHTKEYVYLLFIVETLYGIEDDRSIAVRDRISKIIEETVFRFDFTPPGRKRCKE